MNDNNRSIRLPTEYGAQLAGLFLLLAAIGRAEVKPNALFSDNAVLQQNAEIPVWGTAKDGEKVTITFDGQTETTVAKDGKWMVRLKPHKAGGPFSMSIAGENTLTMNNVLVGEVWVCSGQSNMATKLGGSTNSAVVISKVRMFTVTKQSSLKVQTELTGNWVECSPATGASSAVGYFFGRDIAQTTGFPVGMIHSSVGGTSADLWTSLSGLEKDPELNRYVEGTRKALVDYDAATAKYVPERAAFEAKLKVWEESVGKAYRESLKSWAAENETNKATGKPLLPMPQPSVPKPVGPNSPMRGASTWLFNGMIAPLMPYTIKGVIWYQGESNAGKPLEYRTLFPRLIADWREKWGQGDFPFLFVQLPVFKRFEPEIREAQFLTWKKTPNTAMAVTMDVGEPDNIHPKQKEPVGARLALAARALAYGEKIEYSGPEYDGFKIVGGRVILSFKHRGSGLLAKDGPLKGFTIAGADKKFVAAKAEIVGDTVVVTSEQVAAPVGVRYSWAAVPNGNLWNKEGLPASPFRTDPESMTHELPKN